MDKLVYKYNENNNRIGADAYNPDGTVFIKFRVQYDKFGNKAKEDVFIGSGNIIDAETYEYEFDKKITG